MYPDAFYLLLRIASSWSDEGEARLNLRELSMNKITLRMKITWICISWEEQKSENASNF